MIHKIRAKNAQAEDVFIYYDSHNSTLKDENGNDFVPHLNKVEWEDYFPLSKDNPAGKTKDAQVLKIQLGLSCNYSCTYCNQRFVPHADQTTKKDIDDFIEKIKPWFKGEKIEFWGGEPLVYIKTLIPLAERLRELYPDVKFLMITNGSLLTPELNDWLDKMGFFIGLSHDGPGQHVRGPDPLQDPKSREGILDLYKRFAPVGRISINPMLNNQNTSRAAIYEYLAEAFDDPNINLGEGSLISPYDEGGLSTSLDSEEDHFAFRRQAQYEIRSLQVKNFNIFNQKLQTFINSLLSRKPASSLMQNCAMDRPDNISVDLKGNVITCQNVSIVSTAANGESHKIGHLDDFDNIKLNTSSHWSTRKNCSGCPVLQLCAGQCMFLEGPLHDKACDASYSDNVVFLFAGIEAVTGLVPYYIETEYLPEMRRDVFGVDYKPKKKKTLIPIKAI
ncbi:hypothetical protein [Ralstonia phage RSP15]|uniref:radical SAM domain-containing protein n=1 Tax=Ralstonia phage RSP15 TaxID=1785960 RepID=UPI00074D4A81|nr:radical SAM domain-containing protein [Ralstonia phage RSP15]BAU40003.1 hypothetical protein [Ralstonia phage RSP15]